MPGRTSKPLLAMLAGAIVALALLALAGCGPTSGNEPDSAEPEPSATALGSYPMAESALSTTAPDAKLLVVQTAQSVTSTGTPVWAYLFGDQASDKTYLVYISDGQVMSAQEYGTVGLSAEEWAEVPDSSEWKIDSDKAVDAAMKESGQTGTPTYAMGMQLYVPRSVEETKTAKPMVWYVYLGEESTTPIGIDAKTGAIIAE